MITNIQHFLDKNRNVANLPGEVLELLRFLSSVIKVASAVYDEPVPFSNTKSSIVITK